jgi:thiaminase/4-amino-5-aminomethyl-2-methylpyrimidine deaminase
MVLTAADKILYRVREELWASVVRSFRISSIYEYLFWDSAYRLEKWVFKL